MDSKKPKYKGLIEGANQLSLGISIVVALLMGIGAGVLMKSYIGYDWLLWLGIFWGIAAAGLNIKKAYDKQKHELDKLKDDPKYRHAKKGLDD